MTLWRAKNRVAAVWFGGLRLPYGCREHTVSYMWPWYYAERHRMHPLTGVTERKKYKPSLMLAHCTPNAWDLMPTQYTPNVHPVHTNDSSSTHFKWSKLF